MSCTSRENFYKEITTFLKTIDYTIRSYEPCLLTKWINSNLIVIGLYVDDLLMVGNKDNLLHEIELMKRRFSIRIKDEVDKFLGCQIIQTKEN